MRRIIFSFLIMCIALTAFSANISVRSGASYYDIQNISGQYNIKINSFNIDEFENWAKINMGEGDFTNRIGYPKLPAVRFYVKSKTGILSVNSIKEGSSESFDLNNLNGVYPVQMSQNKSKEKNQFVKDDGFYSGFDSYPEKRINIIDAGKVDGEYVHLVEVYPFSYSAKSNQVILYSEINFELTGITEAEKDDYDEIPSTYLFVTHSTLLPAIGNLIEWKKTKGFHTEVILTDTLGGTNTGIKAGIQNIYDNAAFPLRFVLLVGDINYIPQFTGTEEDYPPTDLYYSTLSGSDYFPDVYVGRFPASDTATVRIIANKTIMYEKSLWGGSDGWTRKAYLMATDDGGFYTVAEGTQNYVKSLLRGIGMTVDTLYAYSGTGTPISTALNDGRSLAVYTGHGATTYWAGPSFTQANILALTNGNMLPFVSSYACLTGNFAYGSDCFGETWVKANNKGSVTYLGSSVTSLWDEDDIMERSYFNGFIDSNYMFIGKLMNYGKMAVYSNYSGTGYSKRYFEQYNILGDPSLAFYTKIEDSLFVDILPSIPASQESIYINIKRKSDNLAVDGALVSLIRNDSLIFTGYTNAFGEIEFYNNSLPNDTIYVYASKPDYRFGSSSAEIIETAFFPIISGILFYDTLYTLNFSDSLFSASDSGYMNINISNLGNDTIFGLACSLSFYDTAFNVYGSVFSFPDTIPPSADALGDNPILVKVKDHIKNSSSFIFGFKLYDSDDSTKNSNKRVYVNAPETRISEIIYLSPDKFFSANDTVPFILKLKNVSVEGDKGINVYGESADTNILKISAGISHIANLGALDSVFTDTFYMYIGSVGDSFLSGEFSITISDTLGHIDSENYVIKINKLDYLVLNYAKDLVSGLIVDSLLQELNYIGNYKTSVSDTELKYYEHVFLMLGAYPNNSVISNSSSVASALDSLSRAGDMNLYIEGGECWYWDPSYSSGYDFNNLFGINPVNDGSSTAPAILYGANGTITEGLSYTCGTGSYLDELDTLYGSKKTFTYSGDCFAVSRVNPLFRTFGSSFEIGKLTDGTGDNTRLELVNRIMNYFNGLTGISELSVGRKNYEFNLMSISSNLVRSGFEIQYSAPANSDIVFEIVNITGRIVDKKEFNNSSAGIFKIKWSNNRNLSSGIYFMRIGDGNRTITEKVTFIK